MATYKEISGTNIEVVSSDPANPVVGQVWYNTTTGTVKGASVSTTGAWATGGALNTARKYLGSNGTQTSALAYGGESIPSPNVALTESYNGSTWTEVNDLNTSREKLAGAGVDNTSALAFGGYFNTAVTESWNGTSWTEVNDLNTARGVFAGNGTQTSALAYGGYPTFANTESWNGTSWTEVSDLNTVRYDLGGIGADNTSALAFGGGDPITANTETWNGSSWTEVNNLNTGRKELSGAGVQTSGLAFGGATGEPVPANGTGATEEWNGVSWTETSDLSTARSGLRGSGTTSAALAFGGYDGTANTTATEEWTGAGSPVTVTFTDS